MIVVVQLGELGGDGNGDALRKGSDSGADQSARNGREGGLILGECNLLQSTDIQDRGTPMYRERLEDIAQELGQLETSTQLASNTTR